MFYLVFFYIFLSVVIYRGDMPSCGGALPSTQEDPTNLITSACSTTTVAGAAIVIATASSDDDRVQDAK